MNHETNIDKDYDILSLFGKEELENIQRRLSKVTQLAFITVNYRGEPLTNFTSFCSFCSHYRNDPVLHKNCEASDAISSIQSSIIKKPNIYECPYGLMEIAIPIVVNDVYLGGFLCGQATCSNPPEDLTRVKPSINNQNFKDALKATEEFKKELPCFTYERFEDIAFLVSLVIEMLCESKINQISEERNIANKVEVIKKLEVARVNLEHSLYGDDYLSMMKDVEHLARTTYGYIQTYPQDIQSMMQDAKIILTEDCMKLYPVNAQSFYHYHHLFIWMSKCYDYLYREKMIQKYPIMEDVFVYINQHIEDDITLSSIVDHCPISQGYLSKIFRIHFGISVTDYIHLRKICIAKDLLCSTSLSVADISFQLSYNEPTYFSKIFKKYTGQTIQAYRNEIKE